MKILLGIIFFHLLVLYRSKFTAHDGVPYISIFFLTLLLVVFVVVMMFLMPVPES